MNRCNNFFTFKNIFLLVICISISEFSGAQIIPPAMGKAKSGSWFALSLKQNIGQSKKWSSTSFIGQGWKSNPDGGSLLQKPQIFILNEELFHQFAPQWQYSMALSYQLKDEYNSTPPYEHKWPRQRQEFRIYGRLSYSLKNNHLIFSPSFRPEFRKFYRPDFHRPEELFQIRTRFRLKLTVNLTPDKLHRMEITSEQLFSTSKKNGVDKWTKFAYKESRFAIYYTVSLRHAPITFNLGYMNNGVGIKNTYDVHILGFDVVFTNPFRSKKQKK